MLNINIKSIVHINFMLIKHVVHVHHWIHRYCLKLAQLFLAKKLWTRKGRQRETCDPKVTMKPI
jgi:hypothetical protein